jgi:putative PIN family toxin of toxin-antitoxin system
VIVVFDNNVIISAALNTNSIPFQAFEKALIFHSVIRSEKSFLELTKVIYKPKFDKYFKSPGQRKEFLKFFLNRTSFAHVNHTVELCRDPKDDHYLELALSANANIIISGDKDLLVLHPFQRIPIISPTQFLNQSWQ